MDIEQITTILTGIEAQLRFIESSSEYQKVIQSGYFTTLNDLTLGDAIQSIYEVLIGIDIVDANFSKL